MIFINLCVKNMILKKKMFLYQGPSSSYKNHGKSEQSQGRWRWPTGELRSHRSRGQCVGGAEVPQGEATAVWRHIHRGGAEIPGTPCGLGIMQWLLQVWVNWLDFFFTVDKEKLPHRLGIYLIYLVPCTV